MGGKINWRTFAIIVVTQIKTPTHRLQNPSQADASRGEYFKMVVEGVLLLVEPAKSSGFYTDSGADSATFYLCPRQLTVYASVSSVK